MKKTVFFLVIIFLFAGAAAAQEVLSLAQSIELALQNNYSVIAAKEKVKAAEGSLGSARSVLLPKISAQASYVRQYQSPYTLKFNLGGAAQTVQAGFDEAANLTGYNLTFSQPLLTWGKSLAGLEIAQKNLEISIQDLRKTELEAVYQVTAAYYGVLKSKKFVDFAQESIEMAQTQLKQVKAMFKQGLTTRADTLRVEVQLSQANQTLIKAKNGFAVAQCILNAALGRDLNAPLALQTLDYEFGQDLPYSLENLTAEMFGANPDWIKFAFSKKISEQTLAIVRKGYLPDFALAGAYGFTDTEYKNNNLKYGVNSWSITLGGSWDIFTGFARSSKIKEAAANLEIIKAQAENLKKKLALDLKQAYLEVTSTKDQIESAAKGVELAKENLKLAQLKYQSGMGTNLETLDAQASLTQSEVNFISAVFDYLLAKVRINTIAGKKIL